MNYLIGNKPTNIGLGSVKVKRPYGQDAYVFPYNEVISPNFRNAYVEMKKALGYSHVFAVTELMLIFSGLNTRYKYFWLKNKEWGKGNWRKP